MPAPVKPDPLFPPYKRVRNFLRKFEPDSVTGHLITALHSAFAGDIQVRRYYLPWNLLLALKWTWQEADATAHRRPEATLNDVHRALNILHDMEAEGRMPSDFTHINLFMRQLAFQQFWQHQADGGALARQDLLFSKLPSYHPFQRRFFELTGVSVLDATELSFALLTVLLSTTNSRVIHRTWFGNIEPRLTRGALDRFLGHLARSPTQLREWLNEPEVRNVSVSDQLILPSPFLRAPLLDAQGRYHVYYPPLVFRAVEELVYRTLRSDDPAQFSQRFGPVFEAHLEHCLSDAGIAFAKESELLRMLAGTGKCIDFVVTEDDANILIDAKGVEMSALGRVSQRAETIYRAIKESAAKGVFQGMDTTRRMKATTAPAGIRFGTGENFLLIVTFEPLYLGSSNALAETLGLEFRARLAKDFGESLPLPLENVFFASVGEFERLLSLIRAKQTTLLTALRHARLADSQPRTRKFDFGQHVAELGTGADRLPFMQAAIDGLCDRCMARLPPELRR